ncbi:MAG TPA: lipocalin-like domain-containing protein [Thermoanaerobaculia bacterium]|jgi:predicted secreted hydrolase|nr:lipocalin-like domain-containing protein [Thermoanaerobaculia bacterium]
MARRARGYKLTACLAVLLLGAAPLEKPLASHPDAALEWWYWTGHLADTGGRAYGFQVTFFRLRDLHLAHFAWSDVAGKRFTFDEKTHLELPGMAGASAERLDVFNEDWSAVEKDGRVALKARGEPGSLRLTLTPAKPLVAHGEGGISRKGPGPDDYSHYVSVTRLTAAGSLTAGGVSRALHGDAWFDHEWGPGGLPAGIAGWDWFALQLSDSSELMLYRMRMRGGEASPFSAGTFVDPGGRSTPIAWSDVSIAPKSTWTSPRTKATYPATWSVAVRSIGLEATVTPLLADQELVTSKSTGVTYWEGACAVSGTRGGRPIGGRAYVEMTGYAGRDVPGLGREP